MAGKNGKQKRTPLMPDYDLTVCQGEVNAHKGINPFNLDDPIDPEVEVDNRVDELIKENKEEEDGN